MPYGDRYQTGNLSADLLMPETKCVETIVVTIAAAVIVLANRDMFFETRHVGRLLETLQEEKG